MIDINGTVEFIWYSEQNEQFVNWGCFLSHKDVQRCPLSVVFWWLAATAHHSIWGLVEKPTGTMCNYWYMVYTTGVP